MPAQSGQPKAELTSVHIAGERRQTRPLALTVVGLASLNEMTDDFLRVSSLQGQEGISQPFQFNLELRANDVEQLTSNQLNSLATFDTLQAIGLWAIVRVTNPDSNNHFEHKPTDAPPGWENATPSRFFHGVVTSMAMAAPGVYHLSISAPLHNLTLRNRYHIYPDCDIQSLFTQLLGSETMSGKLQLEFRFDDSLTVSRVQDWMQAGESDFAFLQRVASKAAIHFYFIHQQDKLVLVFSNRPTALSEVAIPGCNGASLCLRYSYSGMEKLGLQQNDLFTELNYQVKMVQNTVAGVLTREEAQWEDNKVAGFASYDVDDSEQAPPQFLLHHRYSYGTNPSGSSGAG